MADDNADLRNLKERFLLGMTSDPMPLSGLEVRLSLSLVHRGRLV